MAMQNGDQGNSISVNMAGKCDRCGGLCKRVVAALEGRPVVAALGAGGYNRDVDTDRILSHYGSIMATEEPGIHPVARRRAARGWSQTELARRAGTPRTSVSAIEGDRLTPSVAAALALARALECSVEELFGGAEAIPSAGSQWAWTPRTEPCRYWEAEVNGRRRLYPVEAISLNVFPHDGVWEGGVGREAGPTAAEATLVAACCDPAAGLLASEYARASGFRLLVLPRGGAAALDLLKNGLVHLAGLHRATEDHPFLNAETARAQLGRGYRLLRVARWQEGVALPAGERTRSLPALLRRGGRWALREPGSAARECLDELFGTRRASGRCVRSHAAVAEAVRGGWAGAGVCVRLAAEEAGLNFLPVRVEALDFCFADSLTRDPRFQALLRLLRSRAHRRLVSELPGYDARETGELLEP
jgi:molybdate-binding protein/transcriptional regulator with XRE-family HTH domain